MTSVTIGSGVTSIGESAFAECTSLTSVSIGNGVTSMGDYAFGRCSSLTSVTIASGVTSIGMEAFSFCSSLTSIIIPNSVTSIGDSAFYYCIGLTSVSIGSGVTNMGYSAFFNCIGLSSVTIGNGVTCIGDGAFEFCKSLTSVIIPDSVTNIGNFGFSYCSSLTSVTIGSGVTNMGYSAFSNCIGLSSVTIGNGVTSIGDGAFEFCKNLTSVNIPNSVTSIGDYAFYCDGLTSVTIGSGVTSIGDLAFYGCLLTSVVIPDSVMSIGDWAFSYCYLTSAYFLGNAPTMGDSVFYDCASGFTVYFFSGKTGFTLPTWMDYPSAIISNSISGTVSGAVQQGVTLTLSGAASSTTTSGTDGTFIFVASDGSYTVTPSLSGYTFTPSNRTITISGKNVTGCDFVATKNPGIYSISGTVSGDIKAGVTITLSGALSSTTLSGADGSYSFTGLADGSYTVTPELSGYIFTPFSKEVSISGTNQTGVDFTTAAISIYGTISKPSFNASHKDAVKKINGTNVQYSTDKFTVQTTIQFPGAFDLTTIGESTGFTFDFGLYSFSGKLGNAKSKFNGTNGGSASFKITGNDEIKGKTVTVEKVDLRWDKKKKLAVKITGTPVSDSSTNVVDLSGKADGPVTGSIDTFFLTFNNAGARFAEGESLSYTGKKTTKTVKTFTLVDWSAKGKK